MRTIVRLILAACFIGGFVHHAGAQTDARSIIDRAIKAHGGAEKVARLKVARVTVQGVTLESGTAVPITLQDAWQLPKQYRTQSQFEFGGMKVTRILAISGDKGWTSLNGNVRDMEPTAVAEMKEQAYSESFDKLFPLLNLSALQVSALGEIELEGRKVRGVRLGSAGHRPVSLYFDETTGLLVKRAEKMQGDGGKEVLREVVFSDFKDVDGLKQAMKVTAFYDGKKIIEGKVANSARKRAAVPLERAQAFHSK